MADLNYVWGATFRGSDLRTTMVSGPAQPPTQMDANGVMSRVYLVFITDYIRLVAV